MTQKELLYIEDACNHNKHLEMKCCDFKNKVSDVSLKEFISKLETKNKEMFKELIELLD